MEMGTLVTRKSPVMKTIFSVLFFKRLKEGEIKISNEKPFRRPVCPLSGKMVPHHGPDDHDNNCRNNDSNKSAPGHPNSL